MNETMKEQDPNEEEIVIVEDADSANADDNSDLSSNSQDDERVARAEDEDSGTDESEREAIRERRRKEKQDRKVRREEAIKRDKTELDFLRKRNDDLERRLSAQEHRAYASDLNNLDAAVGQAIKEAEMAERVIAKAVEAGNGEDVAKAMRYRDQAIARVQQLNFQKQQAQQRPPQQQQIDDRTMHHAQEFLRENSWYDPQGRDEDSAIVLAIDQSLNNDGYDPRTEEYWDELRSRAAKRLPEKFNKQKETRNPRGGPAVGSGREHAPTSTRKEIYISPERKQALIEAGVWDDPVLRNKYVKRYAEYDRANRS